MARRWFDAHLDLAYMARRGRDMHHTDPARAGGPDQPGAVTLPALGEGGVTAVLGTIFLEPGGTDECSYPPGDGEAANRLGLEQLAIYERWFADGDAAPLRAPASSLRHRAAPPLSLGILIEGADCILSPADVAWWKDRGVVAIGLAWARQSRYAGGNSTETGLTDLGRAIIPEIDRAGVVHDCSHLSDRSLAELLDLAAGPVMASHSNCRALIGADNQRHLTDAAIRAIAQRGGVIGLNLFSKFLIPGPPTDRRATIDQALAHIEHICSLLGHTRGVGLGSDMDGGFSRDILPEGIDRPRDLERLAEGLSRRGWRDSDIDAFAWGNWARFWRL
ncbi:MAG: membrane dipeptidase [Phycisphaerales bacterium]|nr:membrane dipeptidase [Phycisphaerales bacterium]